MFKSAKGKAGKLAGSIGDYFSGTETWDFPDKPSIFNQPPPSSVATIKKPGSVNPDKITEALRHLEAAGGTHPDTPRNRRRSYTTVPANGNEQARTVEYDTGYGGEFGLTPVALAEMAGSTIDMNADPSTYTQHGKPLISGMDPKEIQRELMTPEGAGRLANKFFMSKRMSKEDYTPQSLTNDYIDFYVGKGGPSDTPENRARTLAYFTSLMD